MALFNQQPFNASNLFGGFSNALNGKPNTQAVSPATQSPTSPSVPTADQTQKAKLIASTNVPSTSVPSVKPQAMTSTQPSVQTQPTIPTIPQVNPFQTSAISSAIQNPNAMPSSYQASQQNAYEANAPIDLNKLAPYSQQVEEANKGVANATNAQRDFERGTYNQATEIGAVNPNQLQTELSTGNRLLNQNIADASTNQTAANQTLATQLALQQAQRTGRVEQAQVPFTTATPVNVPYNTQLLNPFTGQQVGNGGTTPNIASIASQVVNGQMTQDDANNLIAFNPTLAAQLNSEIQKQNPNFSKVGQEASIGADTSSLQGQQQVADTNKTVLGTVTSNGQNILGLMQRTGVSDTGVPVLSALQQGLSSRVLTNNDVAAFKEALNTLRSNYAQINAKGGSVTQENKDAATQAIPDTISIGGLRSVLEQMWNGANTNLTESQKTIEGIKGRLGGSTSGATFKTGQTNATGDLKWDGNHWVKA